MKFVLSSYGGRGDVEPAVVVGRELQRRGHTVCMAVPPNLAGFAEAAGLRTVAYGLDSQPILDAQRNYFTTYFRTPWRLRELGEMARDTERFAVECWSRMTRTLVDVAEEADLLLTGLIFEQPAANVAEYYGIPLVTVQYFPVRPHGRLLPFFPPALNRLGMRTNDLAAWRGTRDGEDAQRRELGLPVATCPAPERIVARGSLEIQAYEEACFPGLAEEWKHWGTLRPFVGGLALASPTDADVDAAAWCADGTPPIFFGFGSVPLASPAETVELIASACAQLGERALIGAGGTDFSNALVADHVKVVGQVNYATIFPRCRAVVHHGGSGTVAAGLRAGIPQLILWTLPDQPSFAAHLWQLKVGTGRRFSVTTEESLVTDLRKILRPECIHNARRLAARVSSPDESVRAAADRVEEFARLRCRA
jgi:UDP:flavonoid glycosyltransferase YjiC (YdhE family)